MLQEILEILLSAFGVIITGITGLAVAKFTEWLEGKIQDRKTTNYVNKILDLVLTSVQEIYQTYVETIKAEGRFDKEAQEHALNMCLTKIKTKCGPEVIDYITNNFGDVDEYLKSLIESSIYTLKNVNKGI